MTESVQTPLTILEEFLLLALDDEAGQFHELARSTLDCVTIGAVLMDLTLRQRLDNDLKNLFIINSAPTGDDILDPVLQVMALAPVFEPHPIAHWLRQFLEEGEALREKALQRLVERGILKREDKKLLWVFGARRYPMLHEKEAQEVKSRILEVILQDDIPYPHDMMLTALAQACGLFRYFLAPRELAAASARIEKVSRMDLVGQAVAKAVTDIESTVAMASGFR